jgi:hypothetical protein
MSVHARSTFGKHHQNESSGEQHPTIFPNLMIEAVEGIHQRPSLALRGCHRDAVDAGQRRPIERIGVAKSLSSRQFSRPDTNSRPNDGTDPTPERHCTRGGRVSFSFTLSVAPELLFSTDGRKSFLIRNKAGDHCETLPNPFSSIVLFSAVQSCSLENNNAAERV